VPSEDLTALGLTLELATVSTLILLVLGTPLAWRLAHSRFRLKAAVEALVALPLVLPPTVLGFYLLVALGTQGPVGRLVEALGGRAPAFTFAGLVIGSVAADEVARLADHLVLLEGGRGTASTTAAASSVRAGARSTRVRISATGPDAVRQSLEKLAASSPGSKPRGDLADGQDRSGSAGSIARAQTSTPTAPPAKPGLS
jgi:ABC-type sulfate transport system permease subunit